MVNPKVSVIIATYNWSAALHCALTSVLRQTVQDFEVLVVGDTCTDDSQAVVESFGDPRLNFTNLPQRSFSQYGPNNHGLAQAKAPYIAYLGHDDLWFPTHLADGLRIMEDTGADVSAGTTMMYGPKASGMLSVAGLFPADEFSPRHFIAPSSLMHRADIIARIGPWRSVEEALKPTDVDFLDRLYAHDLKVVSTKTLTVFKHIAAWRRNAYRDRSIEPQLALLARMQAEPGFRETELVRFAQAVIEGRYQRIHFDRDGDAGNIDKHYGAARFKGAIAVAPTQTLSAAASPLRFERTAGYQGFEWYNLETTGDGRPFRWSGPSTQSEIELVIHIDCPCRFQIDLVRSLRPDTPASLVVRINDDIELMKRSLRA